MRGGGLIDVRKGDECVLAFMLWATNVHRCTNNRIRNERYQMVDVVAIKSNKRENSSHRASHEVGRQAPTQRRLICCQQPVVLPVSAKMELE